MAPRRGRRRNRRRGNRSRGIVETFTFSIINGNSADVLVSTLTSRPPRSNFRPIWLEVDVCGYQPGTSAQAGFLAPVGCQLGFRSESDGTYCSTSRLVLAGAASRKVRTYYPRSADWWPWNVVGSTVICSISAVCVGPTSNTSGYLRGIGRLLLIVQEEQCISDCPAIGDVINPPTPPSSSSSYVCGCHELVNISADGRVKISHDSFDIPT